MYQIQIKIDGNWENTVYHPMIKERSSNIINSLRRSYPENFYKTIKVTHL